ncbi:MAG: hypothetical protein V3V62_03090 [bacterium]
MEGARWKSWTGLLFMLFGGALFLFDLGPSFDDLAAADDSYTFSLRFLGGRLIRLPVGAEIARAALALLRWAVPGAPFLIGALFLFLDTPSGERWAHALAEWMKRREEG